MNFFKLRGHKYGAQKTSKSNWIGQETTRVVGEQIYKFASKAEAHLFDWLMLRQQNGEISNLKTQVSVHMTKARILYKPDFSFEEEGETVFAEMKGRESEKWRIKRRLWMAGYGPAKLQVYKKIGGNLLLTEEITPKEDLSEHNIVTPKKRKRKK